MRAVSLTNRGGRENNEDAIRHATRDGIWCFCLCDGLGGHECGEVASAVAADNVCREFEKNPELSKEAAESYLKAAAEAISVEREKREIGHNMSTTAVVLVTDGKKAVWGHIGDSRLYHLRGGEILSITDDHSIAFFEFKRKIISYNDIRHSANQNKLTRCIGDIELFNPDLSEVVDLTDNDAFLLCSDGFWEYVSEDDIESTSQISFKPKVWLEKMLEILHKNEAENNDNYSVIAVMV